MLGPGVHASRINVICVHGLIGGIGHGACSSLPALADEAYAPARARLSESWCNISPDAIVGDPPGNTWSLGSKVAKSMQGTDPGAHVQVSCIKDLFRDSVDWLLGYFMLTHHTQGKFNIKELRRHHARFKSDRGKPRPLRQKESDMALAT